MTERVGNHANFIGIHGRLLHHPEGKQGMILPLLNASDYYPLGKPPSFDSISRDTFETYQVFSVLFIAAIARSIAAACEHLHTCGIIHGDLYAHNILCTSDGSSCILSDFGAATFLLDKFPPGAVEQLQKMEVRAFGYLLDDLLLRVDQMTITSEHSSLYLLLQRLREDCLLVDLDSRPSFEQIRRQLEANSS